MNENIELLIMLLASGHAFSCGIVISEYLVLTATVTCYRFAAVTRYHTYDFNSDIRHVDTVFIFETIKLPYL